MTVPVHRPTLKSQILPQLFDQVIEGQRFTVFDAGLAVADSLAFFSQYTCRLHFADLYTEVNNDQHDELTAAERAMQFHQLFNLPPQSKVDICLLWDFLNYLDGDTLRAFAKALKTYLHPNTRIHAFGVHKPSTTLPATHYGIVDQQTLSMAPRSDLSPDFAPARYPRKQGELSKLLPEFEVTRSTLLADGTLDMLLRLK